MALTNEQIAAVKVYVQDVARSSMRTARDVHRTLLHELDLIVRLNKEVDALKAEIEQLRTVKPATDDGWDRVVSASYNDDGGEAFSSELADYNARLNMLNGK